MVMRLVPFCTLALVLMTNAVAADQTTDNSHNQHQQHLSTPVEQGQSAFAAIAEIVAILNDDPATDWGRVNIAALREHLVDMSVLSLETSVAQTASDGEIVITVTGIGSALRAIHTMVPAHSAELNRSTNWHVTTETNERGAVMRISAASDELERIKALGFFGVMATGSHHQDHHLRIARGDSAHH